MSTEMDNNWSLIAEMYQQMMEEYTAESEALWNSMSKDDQLKVFCAVIRRLHEGEIKRKGSYRYILYDVFGFGADAYTQAQEAGYIDIHNAIYRD